MEGSKLTSFVLTSAIWLFLVRLRMLQLASKTPKIHTRCAVLGCLSTNLSRERFYRLSSSNSFLLSKVLERGHQLKSTSSSSRICGRHFEKDEFGLLPGRIIPGNQLTVKTNGVQITNPSKRKKKDRNFVPPTKRRKLSPDVEVELNPLAAPSELEICKSLCEEQQKKIIELEILVKSLQDEVRIASSSLRLKQEVLKAMELTDSKKEIYFHCDFENEAQCKSWCGIQNVLSLWNDIEPLLSLSEYQNRALREDGISPQGFFNKLLMWLRKGLSLKELKGNMSKSTFSNRAKYFIQALKPWAMKMVCFPLTVESWMEANNGMKTSNVRKDETIRKLYPNQVFFFADGSYSQVSEPNLCSMSRRNFWNSKHNCHAVSYFILSDPTGRIVFTSKVYEGSVGDAEAWKSADMFGILKHSFPANFFSSQPHITPSIGGDKAFPRVKIPDHWKLHTTRIKASKADLKDIKCVVDPNLAPHRSVVERSIGRLKRWKIWNNQSFLSVQSFSFLSDLLLITAALTNYELFVDRKLKLI